MSIVPKTWACSPSNVRIPQHLSHARHQHAAHAMKSSLVVAIAISCIQACSAFTTSPRKTISTLPCRIDSDNRQGRLHHNHGSPTLLSETKGRDLFDSNPSLLSNFLANLRTASSDGFGTRAKNVGSTMNVGDVVVPICSNLDKRQSLAQIGLYAGVEYVICDIEEGDGEEGKRLLDQRVATLEPAYPLRAHLERSDWPISLPVSEVPLWLSKATYEAGTALGTLMLAGTYLAVASLAATVLRVVVVPSESMEPALMPGDVVLVTRSIFTKPKPNDVVFFNPPSELDMAIANSKIGRAASAASNNNSEKIPVVSTKGKQFIKRVVGVPGDVVGVREANPFVALNCRNANTKCTYRVDRTGPYSRPDIFPAESWNRVSPTINIDSVEETSEISSTLAKGQYFVAGDNGYRSVDSRVWGPLKEKYLFGTAKWVISPRHFGPIQPGPFLEEEW